MKVQVRLLFNLESETDKLTVAAEALLQKTISAKNHIEIQRMFTDWFEWMDYEKWCEKWKIERKINVKEEMLKHAEWIKHNRIGYTPTFFINGKKLPARYNLNNLEKLIPELANEVIA